MKQSIPLEAHHGSTVSLGAIIICRESWGFFFFLVWESRQSIERFISDPAGSNIATSRLFLCHRQIRICQSNSRFLAPYEQHSRNEQNDKTKYSHQNVHVPQAHSTDPRCECEKNNHREHVT